jgi:hypothetical protein
MHVQLVKFKTPFIRNLEVNKSYNKKNSCDVELCVALPKLALYDFTHLERRNLMANSIGPIFDEIWVSPPIWHEV